MTVKPAYWHSVHPEPFDPDCPTCLGDPFKPGEPYAGGADPPLSAFLAGLCAGVLLLALALLLARAVWP